MSYYVGINAVFVLNTIQMNIYRENKFMLTTSFLKLIQITNQMYPTLGNPEYQFQQQMLNWTLSV